jgi:hypothetical protein
MAGVNGLPRPASRLGLAWPASGDPTAVVAASGTSNPRRPSAAPAARLLSRAASQRAEAAVHPVAGRGAGAGADAARPP